MKIFKRAAVACGVALLCTAFTPGVRADGWNRKTTVTFSAPVEIPGVHLKGWGVLPPGTYVFKILDSQSDRHIVQIFDKDETIVYATILAIPNYRLKATDKTVITFRERPEGQPEALRAWFYPGMNSGEEFVYPRTKAIELAKSTNAPVLFTTTEIPVEVETPTVYEPLVAQLKAVPVMAASPTGDEVELAQVVTPPPPVETAPVLPATASWLPLIGLLGMLSLGSALVVRAAANRA